jgi:hypothetical protein
MVHHMKILVSGAPIKVMVQNTASFFKQDNTSSGQKRIHRITYFLMYFLLTHLRGKIIYFLEAPNSRLPTPNF